jgi:hypothetical protein
MNDTRIDFRIPSDLRAALTTLAANVKEQHAVDVSVPDLLRLAIKRVTDNPALLFRPPAMEHA